VTLPPPERATLEAIAARLIPADALGPGAAEAGAVVYIERALEGAYAIHRERYLSGVRALDAAARSEAGSAFAALDGEAQDELLAGFETSEHREERAFFELVREHVIEGMFGDPDWGGNVGRAGWALVDYPGPRRTWSEQEQQLDVLPETR
jgi:gluconate 2-dehydrogenase gamma chain